MSNDQLQTNSSKNIAKRQSYMKRSDFLLPVICVVFAIFFIVCGVLLKSNAKSSFSMTEVSDWPELRFQNQGNSERKKKLNITISTEEEMALFNKFLQSGNGDIGADYYLLADIALPKSWTPTELYDNFHGMDFEGRCHTISGLQVSGVDLGGLFSCVGNCTIDHLTVRGDVEARIAGGGIAAVAAAGTVLDSCISEVNVSVSAAGENCFAGGLIGSVTASQTEELLRIVGCQNLGNVNISCDGNLCAAGGILGGSSCAVSSGNLQLIGCRNKGDIFSRGNANNADIFNACGGIVGAVNCVDQGVLTLAVSDCVNDGYVGGISASGGILGSLRQNGGEEISYGTVARCTNYGTVEHQQHYGNNSAPIATAAWAGGIAGCTNTMLALTECANYGAVNIRDHTDQVMVAGILGAVLYDTAQLSSAGFGYASLYSCANYGNSNAVCLAGLLAQNAGFAFLANSFSTGCDAKGLCRALGNLTASISADSEQRGGFWAYDVYQSDSDSLFYDAFLPNGDTIVRKDGTRSISYVHGIYSVDDIQMGTDAAVMAQRLEKGQTQLPLAKHDQNVYAIAGSADGNSLTFCGDGSDLNFSADELRGDHTSQAEELKNNHLYWGVRYHGEENAVPVLGQRLSLSLLRNGKTVGGSRVVRLMQKDAAGNYVLAYQLHYDPAADTYTANGVLPGSYALSFDDSFGEGTVLTVEENWQLAEKTEARYCNNKTVELCTVSYYQSGTDTPIKTDFVIKGGVFEPPESVPTEEGYVFLGWNTDAAATEPLDSFDETFWNLADNNNGSVIKLYAVIVRREPVHVQILSDGEPAVVSSVTLYRGDQQKAELRYVKEKHRYELPFIEDGNYNVYVDGVNTDLVLKVQDGYAAAVISYHTVEFYADGDSSAPLLSMLVQAGHTISEPLRLPEGIEGSVRYWRTEDGELYDLTAPVNEKLQLYAIWELADGELSEDAPPSVPSTGGNATETPPEQAGETGDGTETGVGDGGDGDKAEPVYYVVNSELEGLTLEGKKKASDSKSYTGILHPEEGFMLPPSIRVVMGDEETELTVSYNSATGVFSIPANTVSGDLTISAAGLPVVNYAVTSKITSCMLYSATADSQTGYLGTLTPNAGYKLPQKLTATMGGAEFTDFTYNATTGVIKVKATAISGDLVFAGSAVPAMQADAYQVTASIGHGSAVVTKGSAAAELEVQIIPADGYSYPQSILVIAGNRSFTDFSYDASTGILRIGSGKVDRIIISGVCMDHSVPVKNLGDRSSVPKAGITGAGEAHRISLPFTDVVPGDWCYDSVRFVYEHKLMSGSSAGFKPDSRMTREMLWVALARLDGVSVETNAYSTGRTWAIRSGISDGKNGSSPLTRQQFAAMLYRVAGEPAVKGTLDGFSDGVSVASYAKNSVLWAEEKGLLTGYADGTLRPGAYITRAQAATILMRYCQTILGI